MRTRVFIGTTLSLLLAACAGSESKQEYTLDSTQLRQFQGNEELVFEVNGKFLSGTLESQFTDEATITWNASQEVHHPQRDEPLSGLFMETFEFDAPNVPREIVKRHYEQDVEGSLFLYAMEIGDHGLLWALPSDDTAPLGIEVIHSPLPNTTLTATYELWQCTSLNACEHVANVMEEFNYNGVEKVATPYADFETYRFIHGMQLTSAKPSFDISDFQLLREVVWIYPGLGPVKINRERQGNTHTEFTGFLVSTNVKLPES